MIEVCNVTGCSTSDVISVKDVMLDTIGYFKASNTGSGDEFSRVALSSDGGTLALESFAAQAAGSKWDPSLKVAWYKDHQPPLSPPLEQMSGHIRRLHDLYEDLNPRWTEGAAMPIIAPITVRSMSQMAARAARRTLRSYRKKVRSFV